MSVDTDRIRRGARVDSTLRQQRKLEKRMQRDQELDNARELPDDARELPDETLRQFIRDISATADDLW